MQRVYLFFVLFLFLAAPPSYSTEEVCGDPLDPLHEALLGTFYAPSLDAEISVSCLGVVSATSREYGSALDLIQKEGFTYERYSSSKDSKAIVGLKLKNNTRHHRITYALTYSFKKNSYSISIGFSDSSTGSFDTISYPYPPKSAPAFKR